MNNCDIERLANITPGEIVGFSSSLGSGFVVAKTGKNGWIDINHETIGFYLGFNNLDSKNFELRKLNIKGDEIIYLNDPFEKIPNRKKIRLKSEEYKSFGTYFVDKLHIGKREILEGLWDVSNGYHIQWFKKWSFFGF